MKRTVRIVNLYMLSEYPYNLRNNYAVIRAVTIQNF